MYLVIGLLGLSTIFFFLWVVDNMRPKRQKKSYRKVATSARKCRFSDPRY